MSELECICGRPMDEHSVQEIKARAKQYLDADDAGLINSLKRDIQQFTSPLEDPQEDAGHDRVARLSKALTEAVRRRRTLISRSAPLGNNLSTAEMSSWRRGNVNWPKRPRLIPSFWICLPPYKGRVRLMRQLTRQCR